MSNDVERMTPSLARPPVTYAQRTRRSASPNSHSASEVRPLDTREAALRSALEAVFCAARCTGIIHHPPKKGDRSTLRPTRSLARECDRPWPVGFHLQQVIASYDRFGDGLTTVRADLVEEKLAAPAVVAEVDDEFPSHAHRAVMVGVTRTGARAC